MNSRQPAYSRCLVMIDPSLRAVLRSRYTIRRFFVSFGGLLAGLLLLLFAITALAPAGDVWREASTNFLGNFAASVAAFLVVYGFYLYVTPPGLRNAEVVPLRDVEIGDEIIRGINGVSDYWFWGRSGAYFRSAVLPKLDEAARQERRHVTIRVVLPDPGQGNNGDLYRRFKQGLGEAADGNTLAANVLATVTSVVRVCQENPYLKAEIGLCPSLPVLRFDLSSAGGLITRDARNLPAILVNAQNPYFEMFRDAVENELSQARRLSWDTPSMAAMPADQFAPEFVAAIHGMPSFSPEMVEAARKSVTERSSRYVR